MRDLQAHQKMGEAARTFQDMADRTRISYEEYATKGGNAAEEIDGEIHSKMAKIYWF